MIIVPVLALVLATAAVAASPAADVVVVCPQDWRGAMAEWADHRQAQGRRLRFVQPRATADQTLAAAKAAVGGLLAPGWLVLVGDAPLENQPAGAGTPCWFSEAVVNRRWGSEPTLPTDLPYGDWDGDGVAEVAVGRLPVDSAEELSRYTQRVIAEEARLAVELGEHRLNIVASPGRFSPLLDRVIETTATRLLTQLTPPCCDLHLTYADWRSPFCPYPPSIAEAVSQGLRQRAVAWVYLGHSHRKSLDVLHTPRGFAPLLNCQLAGALHADDHPPLAAIVACYAGAFDGPDDCLAEEMFHQPGGPLAVLAGSRVTMPYGNSLLGLELLEGLFHGEQATLGEMIAAAKRRVVAPVDEEKPGESLELRQTVERVAAGFTPKEADRRQERLEHVRMYNLLGDPLLAIRRPADLRIAAALDQNRRRLTVTGECPLAGRCRVRLKPVKNSPPAALASRQELVLDDESRSSFEEQYRAANLSTFAERTLEVAAGAFAVELDLPAELVGAWSVVAEVAGEKGLAMGHTRIEAPAID